MSGDSSTPYVRNIAMHARSSLPAQVDSRGSSYAHTSAGNGGSVTGAIVSATGTVRPEAVSSPVIAPGAASRAPSISKYAGSVAGSAAGDRPSAYEPLPWLPPYISVDGRRTSNASTA